MESSRASARRTSAHYHSALAVRMVWSWAMGTHIFFFFFFLSFVRKMHSICGNKVAAFQYKFHFSLSGSAWRLRKNVIGPNCKLFGRLAADTAEVSAVRLGSFRGDLAPMNNSHQIQIRRNFFAILLIYFIISSSFFLWSHLICRSSLPPFPSTRTGGMPWMQWYGHIWLPNKVFSVRWTMNRRQWRRCRRRFT